MAARQTKRRDTRAKLTPVACKLQDMHQKGCKLLAEVPDSSKYDEHTISKQASQHGLKEPDVRMLRRFADRKLGYSKPELAELITLCEEHRPNIGTSLIRSLLTVPKTERRQFQQRMLAESWSPARTNDESIRRFGRRRQGGRQPEIRDDLDAALVQLEDLTITWRRWVKAFSDKNTGAGFLVTGDDQDDTGRHGRRTQVPTALLDEITAVSSSIGHLSVSVSQQIDKLRKQRERRQARKQ